MGDYDKYFFGADEDFEMTVDDWFNYVPQGFDQMRPPVIPQY